MRSTLGRGSRGDNGVFAGETTGAAITGRFTVQLVDLPEPTSLRPLTDRERAILDGFLFFDYPGVDELPPRLRRSA